MAVETIEKEGDTMADATTASIRTYEDVVEAVEQYKHEHAQVEEALRIFHISDQAYRASVKALYGPHLSWSNSANETAKPLA